MLGLELSPHIVALVSSIPIALACAPSLPESAAPKSRMLEASALERGDVIRYRTLTRADFRATRPPPEFAAIADRVGAATCGRVLTTPDTTLFITERRAADGTTRVGATLQHIGFYALMDRDCSWWNDAIADRQPAYVLEHEQIHLAIFELGARQLNAIAEQITAELAVEGATPHEAKKRAEQELEATLRERTADIVRRSREFDEDTSLGYNPERQKAWLARVRAELRDTADFASR